MSARRGFTLIEVLVVLILVGIGLTYASLTFGGYFQRVAAERAAQVFAQDLTMARNWATRGRRPVVIRFYESGLWYEMEEQGTATDLAQRRFGVNADIDLSGVTLDFVAPSWMTGSSWLERRRSRCARPSRCLSCATARATT